MAIRAPEFPESLEWLNTLTPIKIAELRGKLILIDFWTYCCINCLHILPDLKYFETTYADSLVVIGLHSPKFPNERVAKHVLQAIERYAIHHPVANDPNLMVWQQYGVHAWPTQILIDQNGYISGQFAGEGHRYEIERLIQENLSEKTQQKHVIRQNAEISVAINKPKQQLYYPGKILATDERVYISNTSRHQIIEIDKQGIVQRSFGSGSSGFQNGLAQQAQFCEPQGLAIIEQQLIVADTGNHAIRQIDLATNQVTTLAGTGKQASFFESRHGDARQIALNSPWDLVVYQNLVIIAMAGFHQIWYLNLATYAVEVLAGTGREDLRDGEVASATFAQPSGLAIGLQSLFVADAETSAIRQIDLMTGYTKTLCGTGLFDFGDQDGIGTAARLQHPLGICLDSQQHKLWIADSYNHKLKKLDLTTSMISSVSLPEPLAEPGGISFDNNTLWIADTNNHRIIKYVISSQEFTIISF